MPSSLLNEAVVNAALLQCIQESLAAQGPVAKLRGKKGKKGNPPLRSFELLSMPSMQFAIVYVLDVQEGLWSTPFLLMRGQIRIFTLPGMEGSAPEAIVRDFLSPHSRLNRILVKYRLVSADLTAFWPRTPPREAQFVAHLTKQLWRGLHLSRAVVDQAARRASLEALLSLVQDPPNGRLYAFGTCGEDSSYTHIDICCVVVKGRPRHNQLVRVSGSIWLVTTTCRAYPVFLGAGDWMQFDFAPNRKPRMTASTKLCDGTRITLSVFNQGTNSKQLTGDGRSKNAKPGPDGIGFMLENIHTVSANSTGQCSLRGTVSHFPHKPWGFDKGQCLFRTRAFQKQRQAPRESKECYATPISISFTPRGTSLDVVVTLPADWGGAKWGDQYNAVWMQPTHGKAEAFIYDPLFQAFGEMYILSAGLDLLDEQTRQQERQQESQQQQQHHWAEPERLQAVLESLFPTPAELRAAHSLLRSDDFTVVDFELGAELVLGSKTYTVVAIEEMSGYTEPVVVLASEQHRRVRVPRSLLAKLAGGSASSLPSLLEQQQSPPVQQHALPVQQQHALPLETSLESIPWDAFVEHSVSPTSDEMFQHLLNNDGEGQLSAEDIAQVDIAEFDGQHLPNEEGQLSDLEAEVDIAKFDGQNLLNEEGQLPAEVLDDPQVNFAELDGMPHMDLAAIVEIFPDEDQPQEQGQEQGRKTPRRELADSPQKALHRGAVSISPMSASAAAAAPGIHKPEPREPREPREAARSRRRKIKE